MKILPVKRACELEAETQATRWLVEDLWGENAVGLIGGEPKSFKSFLSLDLAVAVASGAPCLGRYPVARRGPVLLYAAEDALPAVRSRIEGICRQAGVAFDRLDVHVITAPRVRIDHEVDRQALTETVRIVRPILLVLDPFVRLHGVDENASGEVSKLLSFLRDLQRTQSTAVCVVHHARKRAGRERPGQSLRGSSEFHAWGDSNLYVRRTETGDEVEMIVEHRSAPSQAGIRLALNTERGVALRFAGRVKKDKADGDNSPAGRIIAALAETDGLSGDDLRDVCRMKSSTLWSTIADLVEQGKITKKDSRYHASVPLPSLSS